MIFQGVCHENHLNRPCLILQTGGVSLSLAQRGEAKNKLLNAEKQPPPEDEITTSSVSSGENSNQSEFEPGQIVFLKSNPSTRGVVVEMIPGNPENRFKIFIDGAIQIFYASQVQAESPREENEDILPCDQFHAQLSALQIRYPDSPGYLICNAESWAWN